MLFAGGSVQLTVNQSKNPTEENSPAEYFVRPCNATINFQAFEKENGTMYADSLGGITSSNLSCQFPGIARFIYCNPNDDSMSANRATEICTWSEMTFKRWTANSGTS